MNPVGTLNYWRYAINGAVVYDRLLIVLRIGVKYRRSQVRNSEQCNNSILLIAGVA